MVNGERERMGRRGGGKRGVGGEGGERGRGREI